MPLSRLAAVPIVALAIAACGGGEQRIAERCVGDAPGDVATFANADVAFAAPSGARLQADRYSGSSWFTKFGLLVRGRGDVVIRAPDGVTISGWRGTSDRSLRSAVLVTADSRCWTAYPGGLVFSGRRCVRLQVEGPGDKRGTALFGLRRDCTR